MTVYAISSKPCKGVQNVTRSITRQRTTISCHQEDCSQQKEIEIHKRGKDMGERENKAKIDIKIDRERHTDTDRRA